jgi:CheY-like chemotaxis protein
MKSQSLTMGYMELGNYCKEVEQRLRELKEETRVATQDDVLYLQSAQQKITSELQRIQIAGSDVEVVPDVTSHITTETQIPIPKRLLLIEDDTFFEQFYAYKLKEIGYIVDVAKNGVEGLQMLHANKPDVVLLDLIMPIKDGFSVLEEKQHDETINDIPVIVFSTLGQEKDIAKAKSLGAIDYVNKSFFDFRVLLDKIHIVQNSQ